MIVSRSSSLSGARWRTVFLQRRAASPEQIISCSPCPARSNYRLLSTSAHQPDSRARLSTVWLPTGGIARATDEDSHSKLVRAGFLRQAHSGIFHMLPLGLRVQAKLELLIDKYMLRLGASKLSLSSISSEGLWSKSGRLNAVSSELFRFKDRKETKYLLSPTHEEEITSLVAGAVRSYKELPIRLYQITRKYRDELRPRHGLLRSREFVMKDLYTFDCSPPLALSTYHAVRGAYTSLFNELKLPYLEAEADSGTMGGSLSHEFHFPTPNGEDHIISCSHCSYVANEELAETRLPEKVDRVPRTTEHCFQETLRVWRGISVDRSTLINIWYGPATHAGISIDISEVNIHAVKDVIPQFDSSVEDALPLWLSNCPPAADDQQHEHPKTIKRLINLMDCRVPKELIARIEANDFRLPIVPPQLTHILGGTEMVSTSQDPSTGRRFNFLRLQEGDPCPRCDEGSLKIQKAIELGHTFHLGTRYSEPLAARVSVPDMVAASDVIVTDVPNGDSKSSTQQVLMQMGCHGIGITRMIGAVADTLADERGLNWPRVMAPYEVVVVASAGLDGDAEEVYDALCSSADTPGTTHIDVILDDRLQSFPWKLKDADLVGYPVIVVVGRKWRSEQKCEVQCRQLHIRADVQLRHLRVFIDGVLARL